MTSSALAPDLVEEFAGRLEAACREILRTVATTEDELTTIETHEAGSLAEDAAKHTTVAVLARLEGREKHELDEITAARARLATGTYGACEGCHRSIPLARLRAIPTARFCVPCRYREER